MSKVEDFPVLKELFDRLEEVGFEGGTRLIYNVFDEDHDAEHTTLGWSEVGDLFEKTLSEFDFELLGGEYGSEGEGEHCYSVIKVKDKYFRASWSYYSYSGCEYDYIESTLQEVKPVEKTIIVYEAI